MRASDRRLLIVAALATVGFVLAYLFAADSRRIATAAYVLVLGALALVALAGRLGALAPARRPSVFQWRPAVSVRLPSWRRRTWPSDIDMLQGRLVVAARDALDFHVRLRPVLREIAAARLSRRYGIALDRDVRAARTVLGDELWEVVRPDRPAPVDRGAAGPGLEGIRPLIERLEEIG